MSARKHGEVFRSLRMLRELQEIRVALRAIGTEGARRHAVLREVRRTLGEQLRYGDGALGRWGPRLYRLVGTVLRKPKRAS